MRDRCLAILIVVLGFSILGCAGGAGTRPKDVHPADRMLELVDHHLEELDGNIEGLAKHISSLQRMPEATDPNIRELRKLDLAGWKLHQEQWHLQRDHWEFARALLEQRKESPDEKSEILDRWARHEQEFEAALDDFRQERHELERKRLQAEARLFEQYLR